ncbi:hypothetical protein Glove_18g165 [Diversispora epigaea]|uniref:Uncharacterized protein n=1 Tax=Diversispora epigaea TaxID=1348612 RepID=A0A397JPD2_9GLOM|nr:hypothetical protein Glove_18g165 [Diversispora epigaea]
MNISQLSYSKHCILVHNNREYFINYRPIKNCIEILLSNSEILQHFIFKYENKKTRKGLRLMHNTNLQVPKN